MSAFSILWDTEVKDLALACVSEPKLVPLLTQSEDYEPTEEEKAYLEEVKGKYHDPAAMYFISDMIYRVEHALSDGREAQAGITIISIHFVLESPDYLKDVFKGDSSCEEFQKIMALKDGLKKLIEVLVA